MDDLISRAQAIDAILEYMERLCIHIATPNDTESYSYARGLLIGVINDIKQLPSAQPDTYWKEQCQSYEQTINKLRESLSTQPEIIRCCECKYLQCNMRPDGYLPKGVDEFECRHWCGSCDPMDFCSQAERRTG